MKVTVKFPSPTSEPGMRARIVTERSSANLLDDIDLTPCALDELAQWCERHNMEKSAQQLRHEHEQHLKKLEEHEDTLVERLTATRAWRKALEAGS